jgi:dolichol-phosphate mannosyltransferase
VVPITWRNRRTGIAKLKLTEMGSRYFFIMMYVWLEKYFSRGDYHRDAAAATAAPETLGVGEALVSAPPRQTRQ